MASAEALQEEQRGMMASLVTDARAVAERLGADVPDLAIDGGAGVQAHLSFFGQLMSNFLQTATSLDTRLEEESRQLLTVAVSRVFANLRRLQPSFDFQSMTEPLEGPDATEVQAKVKQDVDAYVKRFEAVDDDESTEADEKSSQGEKLEEEA